MKIRQGFCLHLEAAISYKSSAERAQQSGFVRSEDPL